MTAIENSVRNKVGNQAAQDECGKKTRKPDFQWNLAGHYRITLDWQV